MSELKKCPSCLREIKISSNFCKYCGEILKQCPKCLEFNRESDAFCASCGYDIREIKVVSSDRTQKESQEMIISEENTEEGKPKLIIWPPIQQGGYQQRGFQPTYTQQRRYDPISSTGAVYDAQTVQHPYKRVKIIGYLTGPLPTINVLSATFEAFALALALIAVGGVIVALGFVFFEFLVFPILGGILGGALILSAPFFGIYYVSTGWLYKTFSIMRPTKTRTIILNYGFATLIFTLIGLIIAPLLMDGGAISLTFAIIGGIIFLIALTIVPLKAFLADLVYVKAAISAREEEKQKEEKEKIIEQ